MSNIDPDFMYHKLAILTQVKPTIQRKRKLGEERSLTVEHKATQSWLYQENHLHHVVSKCRLLTSFYKLNSFTSMKGEKI